MSEKRKKGDDLKKHVIYIDDK